MSEDILTELSEVIRSHPWWKARAKLVLAVLRRFGVNPPAVILDAGCGWGVNLNVLEQCGYKVAGLDISRQSLQRLDRPDRELIEADLTQPIPESAKPYDAVIALDVIEHLDNDRVAVARMAELTKPGGLVIISVPALPELYSEFDAVQGHRRRYLPETLREAFSESKLAVEHLLWWGSWMVPILKWQRNHRKRLAQGSPAQVYRQYLNLPPWPISVAFRIAFSVDKFRTLYGKPRRGTSLFAIARRLG
jgi:cyclopropane fatty-acyl-phospholipid synthase-like methyltransferase